MDNASSPIRAVGPSSKQFFDKLVLSNIVDMTMLESYHVHRGEKERKKIQREQEKKIARKRIETKRPSKSKNVGGI